ncbi:MAG: ATP synthase F1 subunit delta [Lachnospiraceae bacterium]|nr:ATP synthase F1 subunit delta [Lachnospiraceae bacterium]
MAKLISKTYGEALFELAVEEEKTEVMLQEITDIREIFNENEDYLRFLNHPRISSEDKIKSIKEVFENKVDSQILGFLELVITKARTENMIEILDYFLDRMKAFKGIGVCYVTTPMVLSEDKKEALCKKLLDTTSFKEMEMHYEIEPALLGGMRIRIGDKVVDSSIQTKLNRLQKDLLKVQI